MAKKQPSERNVVPVEKLEAALQRLSSVQRKMGFIEQENNAYKQKINDKIGQVKAEANDLQKIVTRLLQPDKVKNCESASALAANASTSMESLSSSFMNFDNKSTDDSYLCIIDGGESSNSTAEMNSATSQPDLRQLMRDQEKKIADLDAMLNHLKTRILEIHENSNPDLLEVAIDEQLGLDYKTRNVSNIT